MNDDATSSVLGAILVIAIGISFMATVKLEYEPRWNEEKESAHFEDLLNQFADLKAQTEKQAENRTLAPVSSPLTLMPDGGSGMFSRPVSGGQLAFTANTINTTAFAPTLTVIEKDGQSLGLLNEQWTVSGGSSVIEEVERIDSLRIRFTGPNTDKLEFKKTAYAELEVTDANGNFAGSFRTYIPQKDKHDMWVKVVTATGEVLIDQEYAPDLKYKEHNKFWVDALDPSWPFAQLLQATEAPYSFELTYDFPELEASKWPSVEYAVAYVKHTTDGEEVYIGGGGAASTITNYETVRTGGRLSFDVNYQNYPSAKIVLENGALIVEQDNGASMVLQPHFQVGRSGTETLLNVVSPVYRGISDAMSGRNAASVTTAGIRTEQVFGVAPEIRFTIETEFHDLWIAFFEDQFGDAGVTSPDQYSLIKLPGGVQVNVFGTSASPNVDDIQVRMQQSILRVSLS